MRDYGVFKIADNGNIILKEKYLSVNFTLIMYDKWKIDFSDIKVFNLLKQFKDENENTRFDIRIEGQHIYLYFYLYSTGYLLGAGGIEINETMLNLILKEFPLDDIGPSLNKFIKSIEGQMKIYNAISKENLLKLKLI